MSLLSRLRNVFRADTLDDDIQRELRFHLAEREDDLIASGMTPDAARREARQRFGNVTLRKEETREREDDIQRERRFHLAEREVDLVASGMAPDAARREARLTV